jgi:ribosomal protein S27E
MDIAITCPQCAAEVDLAEEDTVFKCLYCGSILKPTGRNQVQSFFISPRESASKVGKALVRALKGKAMRGLKIAEHQLVYAPYWRVSGMYFQWTFGRKRYHDSYGMSAWESFKNLRANPWFRTFPAFDASKWGLPSLGLRAQVLKIWPFSAQEMGKDSILIRQTVPFKEAAKLIQHSIGAAARRSSTDIEMVKSELVGERYSLLYFPLYCYTLKDNGRKSMLLVDALSHKVIKGRLDMDELKKHPPSDRIPYRPLNFLPFKCPNCGWDFPFKPHARIHVCATCAQAWQERGGEYVSVPYKIATIDESTDASLKYLPFWRLTGVIKAGDAQYRTLKDFYGLFPLPRVLNGQGLKDREISFYVPAFRIRDVRAVDKFAAQLTRTQPQFTETRPSTGEGRDLYEVWLSMKEAKEMAHVLLYSMTKKDHKRTKDIVKDSELHFTHARLLWLPFIEKGIYLRESQTDFALQKNALELD